jgi:cytochrome c556
MRRTPARAVLVAAALAVGLTYLSHVDAADVSDDEFQALLDHDIKVINAAVQGVEKADPKDKKVVEKNASTGIKSAAVIMAGYANNRIGGRDASRDGKAAAVRDTAIQIYKAAEDKNFKAVTELTNGLAAVKPAADPKKIDVTKAFGELTNKEVMDNFKKTSQYGTNVEADVIAFATKKATPTADASVPIAQRLLIMGEYSKSVTKTENEKQKKEWDEYNEKMIKATEDLLAAAKAKKPAADLAKIYNTLNASCTACHDEFK